VSDPTDRRLRIHGETFCRRADRTAMFAQTEELSRTYHYLRTTRGRVSADATQRALHVETPVDRLSGSDRTAGAGAVDRRGRGNGAVVMEQLRQRPSEMADGLSDCILRIAADQDRAAFERLFRHFAPRLKSYFIKRGGDPAAAEEITQETMVALWKNAAQFDPAKASAATWIFTIARNLGIDRLRRARRPSFDPNDPAFLPDEDEPPDRRLERAEAERRLSEVMNELSSNEKSVLMLSFYENQSHGEIAATLGLPVGTVKSRIRLAFGKLRAALEPQIGAGR